MRIVVIAVGKMKQAGLRSAADDYLGRIGRYARVEEIELKDGTPDEVEARFTKAIPDRARVIALEVEGRSYTSEAFAQLIGRGENEGVHAMAFLLGGAYGLPASVRQRANLQVSLSTMILPHRLARVVLAEQIYRGFTILRGEPYSH